MEVSFCCCACLTQPLSFSLFKFKKKSARMTRSKMHKCCRHNFVLITFVLHWLKTLTMCWLTYCPFYLDNETETADVYFSVWLMLPFRFLLYPKDVFLLLYSESHTKGRFKARGLWAVWRLWICLPHWWGKCKTTDVPPGGEESGISSLEQPIERNLLCPHCLCPSLTDITWQ